MALEMHYFFSWFDTLVLNKINDSFDAYPILPEQNRVYGMEIQVSLKLLL
jgi:hypothetical protein